MKQTRLTRGLLLAALVSVLVACAFWLGVNTSGYRPPESPQTQGSPDDSRTAKDATVPSIGDTSNGRRRKLVRSSSNVSDATSAKNMANRPKLDAPFNELEEKLAVSAEAGDYYAACRLAKAADLCFELPLREKALNDRLSIAAAAPAGSTQEQGQVSMMGLDSEDVELGQHTCKDFDDARKHRAWRYLIRAANLGDPHAAARFVLHPPLDTNNVLDDLEGWEAYKTRAMELLNFAATNGDVEALMYAAGIYGGTDSLPLKGANGVEQNPTLATAYFEVLERIGDARSVSFIRGVAPHNVTISGEMRLRADELARGLLQNAYASRSGVALAPGPSDVGEFQGWSCDAQ